MQIAVRLINSKRMDFGLGISIPFLDWHDHTIRTAAIIHIPKLIRHSLPVR